MQTNLIAKGLMSAERQQIAELIAMYEDSAVSNMLLGAARKRAKQAADVFKKSAPSKADTASAKKTAREIANDSKLSTDHLRLRLWCHVCTGLGVPLEASRSSRGVTQSCDQLAAKAGEVVALRHWNAAAKDEKFLSKKYWKEFGSYKFVPLRSPDIEPLSWNYVLDDFRDFVVQQALESADGVESLGAEAKRYVEERIDRETLKQLLEANGTEELTEEGAVRLILSGGSLVGFGVAVELSGFAAYIFAAQLSAIIPFVGGKTMVSLFAFMSEPFVIGPTVVALTSMTGNSAGAEIRKQVSVAVVSLLAIFGMSGSSSDGLEAVLGRAPELVPRSALERYRRLVEHDADTATRRAKVKVEKAGRWLIRSGKETFKNPKFPGVDALLESWERTNGQWA